MAQSFAAGEKEIWESTIDGRVSVEVINSHNRPQTLSVVGKGSRLRLTGEERDLIEEQVRKKQHNPFRNGMLVQVGGPVAGPREEDGELPNTDQALLDSDLGALFTLTGSDFDDAVRALSEVNVRRLKTLIPTYDAAKSQSDFISEHIESEWPLGGDTLSNAEARGDRTVVV